MYFIFKFGRVCERRKLRVNVGKSKVMRCSRYGNEDRMHVILNGEPLDEVDCFKYLGSQVTADGGCERVHRLNEGYRAWGALKIVLSNRGVGIKAKKSLYSYCHFLAVTLPSCLPYPSHLFLLSCQIFIAYG